jgi:hypothetical protein
MAKYLPLPDGSSLKVPDRMSYMEAMQLARDKFPELFEEAKPKPAEPTVGGQVKEFFKGLAPGAVGLVEQAAVGASALLPAEQEEAARKIISEGATALKRPFAAKEGYEDTVGRKFGEAAGSIVPVIAALPFGAPGIAAATALGVGAGAGEARTKAEVEGATEEQRSQATALGSLVGATEVFAPLRILNRIAAPAKAGAAAAIKRAFVAGGEEAAQEAASQAAQNMIAKGIYKPEQAIIEQVGESAAYGGAVGVLAQSLLDMTLGRRARGRMAAEEQRVAQEQAQAAAAQEEAAKNQPDALMALDTQYQQLLARKEELDALAIKPKKGATPEEKQAYQEAKQSAYEFTQNEFLPVRQEWEKRKDAIEALKAQQPAAAPAPEAAPAPAPAPEPIPDVQRLMVEQDTLNRELQGLLPQLQTAAAEGRTDDFRSLNEQRQQLQRRIEARAALIEERGGVAIPEAEFQQQTAAKMSTIDSTITKLQEDFTKAAQAQDFDKATDLGNKLDAAKKQRDALVADTTRRMQALQEKQVGLEQRGQTRELFTPEEAPVPVAQKPEEALSFEVKPAAAAPAVEAKPTEVEQRAEALRKATVAGVSPSRIQELQDQLQSSIPMRDRTDDLFSGINVLRTGVLNNDPVAIQKALNIIDIRKKEELAKTREEKDEAQARFEKAMADRLNVAGEKVTRTATPEQYDSVMNQIMTLRNKVEQPQKNAKRSILQELEELAAEHAMISKALETGIAYKPSMKDKVAQLNATLGKAEAAPEQRPMTPQEKGAAKKRLVAVTNRFNMLNDTKVVPIKRQIDDLYKSLYTREKVEAPATERAARTAELERRARMSQPISRAAQTAARIKRGDVRKEAETSAELRKLAIELGRAQAEYKKLGTNLKRRLETLKAKYGTEDSRVNEFRDAAKLELDQKAMALGKATPEYKAKLNEKVEVMREALKETKFSKQEVPSKRTPQVTRKVSQAPRRFVSGTPESRKATEAEQESFIKDIEEGLARERGEYADFDDEAGPAYRTRGQAAEGVVDAAEAKALADKIKSNLPDNVKFVYAADAGQIPLKLLRMMARDGVDPTTEMVQGAVFPDGTVLVVGDQHTSLRDLEETIQHELVGHYGIDTLIGLKRLQAYADKADLGKLAEEVGGKNLIRELAQTANTLADMGKSESVQRLQVLREIIAHTEEARVTESFRQKAGRWLKELVGMVRAGMRDMGFMELPKLNTSDIFYMLRQSRKAFADKKIGAYRAADGEIAFRSRKQPVTLAKSFAAKQHSVKDKLFGNFLGLGGRVQYVDDYAAVSKALKVGTEKGILNSVDAANAEYALRFGKQVSQFAGQFLTNGAVRRIPDPKGPKGSYIYEAKPGANMLGVAEALNEAGIDNDTQAEAMLTAYVAGLRAKSVGWKKLNFENPAQMEAEYNEVIQFLNANPKAKAAFEKANRIYQEYNNGLIDWLVETGEMTKDKAAELKSKPYIPYYRIDGDTVQLFVEKERPIRIGDIKSQPELKSLVGDNKDILPIFTSAIQNTFILTRMGLRNQAIKDTAFRLHDMGIASKMGPGTGPASSSTVRFKVKGKDHFVVIDQAFGKPGDKDYIPAELVVRGLEGIQTTLPGLFNILGYPADVLRKFVTRAPVYAIRQVIRDPLNAWLTTGSDATPVLSSFVELGKMMAGRSDAEKKLMSMGAISSNVFTGDQRDMEMFLRDVTAGKTGWDKVLAKADQFAMQGDAATRAVIYNDSLKKGLTEQQAALRTLESMNFSRRGLSPTMQALSIMIPFFNAQIQGLDVLYRAFTGQMPYSEQLKVRQKLWTRGLMLAAGSLAYAMMMEDDEAYKRAKPEERLANWFVYIPGIDEPVRVPIPFELGYLFKALPEALYHAAKGDTEAKQAVDGMQKLLTQTVPFTLPQAVKPLTEVILGKSFYSGDIESSREQSLLATERYRDTTTGLARMIGSVTGEVGLSPIKIDYLIRGYTGGLGIAITQMANPLVNVVMPKQEVPEPTTKTSKLPFIGGLFQPVEGRGTIDMAYDRMKQVKEVEGTFKKMVEDGRGAEARAFAQNYSTELALVSTSGAVYKQLGELAKTERQVKAAANMTTEQKDAILKRLDAQREQIARMYLRAYDVTQARKQ